MYKTDSLFSSEFWVTIVETSIAATHTRTLLDGQLAIRPDSGTDEGSL
jgi:hypothetical protein